jgi:hypothetical protein
LPTRILYFRASALKMEAVCSSKTMVCTYMSTRRYVIDIKYVFCDFPHALETNTRLIHSERLQPLSSHSFSVRRS